ncbi:MAG: pseudouridine synthase, partial [Elusimicrobia bacterium]|nr:pseudouridine synthase [Elusimicrobiota bacterium]
MEGILNVYKPRGMTSYDVIRHIKKAYSVELHAPRFALKIGHAGTLDPFAEGVLLILLGRATGLSANFMSMPKIYQGVICLGEE